MLRSKTDYAFILIGRLEKLGRVAEPILDGARHVVSTPLGERDPQVFTASLGFPYSNSSHYKVSNGRVYWPSAVVEVCAPATTPSDQPGGPK